jgi:septum site-determining protein MinD
VASCLAALGRRVLCIDMDVGLRNLDLILGMTDRAVMDFTDVLDGRCSLERAAVPHPRLVGLHLLTAPVSLTPHLDAGRMTALLEQAKEQFDYVLMDSPAGVGAGFRLAAAGADRAVLVSTSDATSLRDAQRAVGELSLSHIQLVVNRVQPKLLRKLRTTIDDAMDTAGLPLLGVVPEDQTVMLSANRGIPVVLNTDGTGAALAYLNIAKRIEGARVPVMRLR